MGENKENTKFPCWINTEDFQVKYLYNQFIKIVSKYISDIKIAEDLFRDIQKNYSKKSRHYHNLTHIFRMTKEWSRIKLNLDNSDAVFLVIMYHDVIYNSAKSDNEQQSADFFRKNVAPKLNFLEDSIMFVYMGILITKHNGELNSVIEKNKDFQYILDMDLEILGESNEKIYDWFRKGVRKEYSIYPNMLYNPGRKKVLEMFLSKEKIYLTKEFEIKEKNARKNLQNEINLYLC